MADLAHYLYHRRFVNVMKNNFYRSSVHLYISICCSPVAKGVHLLYTQP